MRKIDAFAHILPAGYLQHLERHLASTMRPDRLRYYQEGVFGFDPVISDLDARFRVMDRHGDYAQVLVLAVPPLEEVDPPQAAAELARRANDEMADLVLRFPERFAGIRGRPAAGGRNHGVAGSVEAVIPMLWACARPLAG